MSEWKFGVALAAGNCVVHKISEETPLSMLKLGELVIKAGFPPGVFNIVPGYGNIAGEALIRSYKVSKISFTGSTMVGRKVMKASSETNLKKIVLELGGKSPIIVCPSANLDKTVESIWFGFM
jgi:aldehyde dehydrogenase (NAD+)